MRPAHSLHTDSLHILHVTPYYAPAQTYGGVVTAVTGLATAQVERGHRVTVLTTDALTHTSRDPVHHETINGVEVIRCRNLNHTIRARYNLSQPPGMWSVFRRLVNAVGVNAVDVVHTHELRTVENILINRTKPIVLSPHGTLSHLTGRGEFKEIWDLLLGRWLLRKIDAVAALTETEANESRELWDLLNVPFPHCEIIPNGVAPDFAESVAASAHINLRERYQLGSGPVILFLGRLHERKGLQYLIPAFAEISQKIPDAHLLIVGPDEGMFAPAQALTAQFGITQKVIFTGLLQGADQRAALATADLFVLPAVGEGLSMAVLEAMASGLPLIVTPGCNLPDVEKRGAGLLVERDTTALVKALDMLVSDLSRRKTMGEAGKAWVSEMFTWPAIASRTEDLYAQVVSGL